MAALASHRSYPRSRTVAVERRRLEARGLLTRIDDRALALPMAQPLLTPLDGPHRARTSRLAPDRLAFLAAMGVGSFAVVSAAIQLLRFVGH
jgi:hypothetical protein